MAECKCGFTTDPDNNCNGTHKIVKAVKEKICKEIEARCAMGFCEYCKQAVRTVNSI